MAEQSWLDSCTITFPLAAATKRLTGDEDAPADLTIVTDAFWELRVRGIKLTKSGTTVSLADAHSYVEWTSETEFFDLLTTLAPICPDGTYAEFESTYPEADSRKYRLIVAGDGLITDYPRLSWDDPATIAAEANATTPAT